jgi:3-mercaptopyruvate sulfurtransferase SseA
MDAPLSAFLAVLSLMCQSPLDWPPKPSPPPLPNEQTLVSADWLAEALAAGSAVALDVRDAEAYRKDHIPGAIEESKLGAMPVETVVLYEDEARLERVAARYWRLRQAGLKPRVLAGGLAAWRASGGKTTRDVATANASTLSTQQPRDDVALDADELFALLGQAGVALLDVRDARGWEQWETPPAFARGHIPHSLPFDVDALLTPNGAPTDPERIRERVLRHGPRAEDPVPPDSIFILYGDAEDPRAAVAYLLLDAAGFDVRIFPPGFAGWAAASRPVVRVAEPAEVRGLIDPSRQGGRAVVFDLRVERDCALGHLPGAACVPERQLERALDAAVAQHGVEAPLVLYCYGPKCVRSWNAAPVAARKGFRHVYWLRGGTEAWEKAGYALEKSPLPP